MYLSYQFIREQTKLPDITAKELALALTMATVEVDDVIDQAKDLEGVVVGRVLDVMKHPQADRLWVCRVDVKTEELQIICGGTNVVKDMTVAVAKVGSRVRWHGKGDPIKLEKAKIRGLESNGMIAASSELGLAELFPAALDHEIMDLTPYQVRVGDALADALGLVDTIFVIDNKSMTHRPDLWGQYGMAREVAALYRTKLKPLAIRPVPAATHPVQPLTVTVADDGLCPRYDAVVIDDVSTDQSPWWLRRELSAAGVRPINRIVDVMNYVMIVLGQPLHAFDYDSLAGQAIRVEQAADMVSFEALNGVTYEVPAQTLLIKDGNEAVAIAGIIGGTGSAVKEKTKTIVIEAANFSASLIRRSSLALGLRTEASSRFEKKLDPYLVPQALAMATQMVLELCPGSRVVTSVIDAASPLPNAPVIEVTQDFLNRRLGTELDARMVVGILKRLEFEASHKRGVYIIKVPTFRAKDVTRPEDIIEEVARLYGYNNIKPALPRITISEPHTDTTSKVTRKVRNILTRSLGYYELYTYSFADPVWSDALGLTRSRVAVANPLTPDQKYLRPSLIPGLLGKTVENLRWSPDFRLFEIGRVFSKASGEFTVDGTSDTYLPSQPVMVAGVSVGSPETALARYRDVKGELADLLNLLGIEADFKEIAKHPFGSSVFEVRGHAVPVGSFGILQPDKAGKELGHVGIVWWELKMAELVKYADFSRHYQPLPKFPSIVRDAAVLVDAAVQWASIADALKGVSPLLQSLELFDVFTSQKLGDNKKSVAFRMTFQSPKRTLESSEADAAMQKVLKTLEKKFGAVAR